MINVQPVFPATDGMKLGFLPPRVWPIALATRISIANRWTEMVARWQSLRIMV